MSLQFKYLKPLTRRTAIPGLVLLSALACFTFTRAAEKDSPAVTPRIDAERKKGAEQHVRSVALLEEELKKQEVIVARKAEELDKLRQDLGVALADAPDPGSSLAVEPATPLHRMEVLRVEAQADYRRLVSLYDTLNKLSRADLKRAISTASPDALLDRLLQEQTTAEQKLAELMNRYSTNHPDVRSVRSVLDRINQQIDDRLTGILAGFKARLSSEEARIESIQAEIDVARKRESDDAVRRRPYLQAKRDLENLRYVADRLRSRLLQEKLDAQLSRE